ncbi:hypothetical protein CXB51_034729 [Gossypium anomalum]|uniref:Aminotransferase-like plant mobile domain-containing protein n=1 Tax=Gossypium anomalum TaxID=47600 RepID=A0A8J5XXW1_9ROSI|nr:hypothetical protein CXB51_034729 [Gossypium anomalum]
MRWLEDNFQTIGASTSNVEKEQFACTFILRLIGGLLMPDKSYNLVYLRWLLLLADLKESRRLSWVNSTGEFVLRNVSSHNTAEFLANIWHVKVPLVIFATVEMHESDQVMRQVRSMQRIPLPSQELDDLYNIDLRGRLEEDWPTFHKKYIEMWERRYDFLPMCEPFLILELATSPDYMDWFNYNDKSYLLPDSERNRQRRRRRPRRGPINPRLEDGDAMGSTSTPSTPEDLIVVQPLSQCGHERVQPRRRESKLAINPDMHVKVKPKLTSNCQMQ